MHYLFSTLPTLGHFFIGFYFAFYGVWNIYHWTPILAVMAKRGIPHPYFILPIGICLQIITGVMIIFGILVKLAALSLIPFTLIVVWIFHPFWKFEGELRRLNFSIFVANLTVTIGALLMLLNTVSPITSWADFLM